MQAKTKISILRVLLYNYVKKVHIHNYIISSPNIRVAINAIVYISIS